MNICGFWPVCLHRDRVEHQRRNHETVLLNQLSRLLQVSQSTEGAYEIIVDRMTELFPGTAGALYLLNPPRTVLSAIASWGEMLNISTHMLDIHKTGGSRYVGMTRADGSPVAECIIDWGLVDRKSGEARFLPEELR